MKYQLYKGFNKIGEFESIEDAKQFCKDMKGIFNILIPNQFRDSWIQW